MCISYTLQQPTSLPKISSSTPWVFMMPRQHLQVVQSLVLRRVLDFWLHRLRWMQSIPRANCGTMESRRMWVLRTSHHHQSGHKTPRLCTWNVIDYILLELPDFALAWHHFWFEQHVQICVMRGIFCSKVPYVFFVNACIKVISDIKMYFKTHKAFLSI